ncbi:MAG: DUF2715 domain-containing protein [Treponema sp.]
MKSKKIITGFVLLALICSTVFAAETKKSAKSTKSDHAVVITLTPAIGLSATAASSPIGTISILQFDAGFHAALLGIPKAAKGSWLTNLTPMINIDFGMGGKLSGGGETSSNAKTQAILFQMSALCGYTLKPVKNLYLTPAAGLGFSAGSVKTKYTYEIAGEKQTIAYVYKTGTFSIPLFFGLKYFFTDLVGIEVAVIDTLNFGTVITSPYSSFQNTFVMKVGPSFKIGF